MREQVVTQKVGNRSGIGKSKSGVGQRPAKRGSNDNIARLRTVPAGNVSLAALASPNVLPLTSVRAEILGSTVVPPIT